MTAFAGMTGTSPRRCRGETHVSPVYMSFPRMRESIRHSNVFTHIAHCVPRAKARGGHHPGAGRDLSSWERIVTFRSIRASMAGNGTFALHTLLSFGVRHQTQTIDHRTVDRETGMVDPLGCLCASWISPLCRRWGRRPCSPSRSNSSHHFIVGRGRSDQESVNTRDSQCGAMFQCILMAGRLRSVHIWLPRSR